MISRCRPPPKAKILRPGPRWNLNVKLITFFTRTQKTIALGMKRPERMKKKTGQRNENIGCGRGGERGRRGEERWKRKWSKRRKRRRRERSWLVGDVTWCESTNARADLLLLVPLLPLLRQGKVLTWVVLLLPPASSSVVLPGYYTFLVSFLFFSFFFHQTKSLDSAHTFSLYASVLDQGLTVCRSRKELTINSPSSSYCPRCWWRLSLHVSPKPAFTALSLLLLPSYMHDPFHCICF